MEVRSRKSLTDTIKSPEKFGKTLKNIKVLPKSCFQPNQGGVPPPDSEGKQLLGKTLIFFKVSPSFLDFLTATLRPHCVHTSSTTMKTRLFIENNDFSGFSADS